MNKKKKIGFCQVCGEAGGIAVSKSCLNASQLSGHFRSNRKERVAKEKDRETSEYYLPLLPLPIPVKSRLLAKAYGAPQVQSAMCSP